MTFWNGVFEGRKFSSLRLTRLRNATGLECRRPCFKRLLNGHALNTGPQLRVAHALAARIVEKSSSTDPGPAKPRSVSLVTDEAIP